jgi:formyl-CoA transferase
MTTESNPPLSGLRVLEMGTLIAGPFAAKTLGDFAEIRERALSRT